MVEILLESGTNELELLEFTVGTQHFGVNIAKVTEIMEYQAVTAVPGSDPAFEGVFTPRDTVISVIDLHKVLNRKMPDATEGLFVVCHFNKLNVAFHVTSVQGIQRISWEDIEKPPEMSGKDAGTIATGIVKVKDDIILILDFEKIVSDLNTSAVLDTSGINRIEKTINTKFGISVDPESKKTALDFWPQKSKLSQFGIYTEGGFNFSSNTNFNTKQK